MIATFIALVFALLSPALAQEKAGSIKGTIAVKARRANSPVVVYIDGDGPALESLMTGEVAQKNARFKPQGLVVATGAEVSFPNEDKFFHNVYSLAPGASFDLGHYASGHSETVIFNEPGVVDVACNIHADMSMKILVLPNAWYAEVAEDGSFEITGVTPGPHRVVAWSADHTPVIRNVTVVDNEALEFSARLKVSLEYINRGGYP